MFSHHPIYLATILFLEIENLNNPSPTKDFTMKGVYAAIGVLSTLVYHSRANKDFVTLTTKGDAWIQEAVATLVLGDVPNPMGGDVALWSAIMMDKKDFLQGVTENAVPRYDRHHEAIL